MAIDKTLLDQLLADYKKPEDIIAENGLLKELTKAILERALQAELTDHLGFASAGGAKESSPGAVALGTRDVKLPAPEGATRIPPLRAKPRLFGL